MANYLCRFLPDLSTVLKPLPDLLKSDMAWVWSTNQQHAFEQLKIMVTTSPIYAFYDSNLPTVVSADASSYGLGVVIVQLHGYKLLPVAYATRTLTDTEKRYAQIEKELLASTWACEKFARYLVGLKSFTLQTDRKPLITIINSQDLDKAPIRCQRLLMRLMRFSITAKYVPGKELTVANALSRTPLENQEIQDTEQEILVHVEATLETKPVSPQKLTQIKQETTTDEQLQIAMKYVKHGWPEHARNVPVQIHDLYCARLQLSVVDNMLVYGNRIVIPTTLRPDILSRIHEGHMGINKCKERAQTTVWWPGIGQDIERKVIECLFCMENKHNQHKEPLLAASLPDRPWQRIGADLCEQAGQKYLVVVDYYSRYIEIAHLTNMTSGQTIGKMKNMFAHLGIPDEVVTDNGTQFSSDKFRVFAETYGFGHTTSSLYFPQSNGELERAVQTAKKILKQDDPFLALMAIVQHLYTQHR